MKKLFSILMCLSILAFTESAHAQISTLVPATTAISGTITTTLTGADTAHATLKLNYEVESVSVFDTKVSGTVGGKWYLRGSNNGGVTWDKLDSLVRVDGEAHKTFAFPYKSLPYDQYELTGFQSGSSPKSNFKIYMLRRVARGQ